MGLERRTSIQSSLWSSNLFAACFQQLIFICGLFPNVLSYSESSKINSIFRRAEVSFLTFSNFLPPLYKQRLCLFFIFIDKPLIFFFLINTFPPCSGSKKEYILTANVVQLWKSPLTKRMRTWKTGSLDTSSSFDPHEKGKASKGKVRQHRQGCSEATVMAK